ncbi:Rv1535 domain-containing protein [Mycobacterium syngnathidarum]
MGHLHPPHDRQCHGESARILHRAHRITVAGGWFRFFCHWSPFRHVDFGFSRSRLRSVRDVRTSGSGAPSDPLTDAVSRVLVLPLRELYAVLWRCGVLDLED